MVRVEDAEKIILQECRDYGTEVLAFDDCLGRVLAENIYADRNMPPFNRVTMDGIAIRHAAFQNGIRSFHIKSTQAAGDMPVDISRDDECIEIMTGAALPPTTDSIVPYEEVSISNGTAFIKAQQVLAGQNIHPQGKDKKQNDLLAEAGQTVTAAVVTVAAAVGKTQLLLKKNPRVMIVSTGNELVGVDEMPSAFEVRRSNSYMLQAVLKQHALDADLLHLPDDPGIIRLGLQQLIDNYDVLIISGGVSMGKHDYVPDALEQLGVQKKFHKVQQRPGKPFWFGVHANGVPVFAFPGNPVSGFMCLHRYFLPWLENSMQVKTNKYYAVLDEDVVFRLELRYFMQVKLRTNETGRLLATPVQGHGSGDFINLLYTDAFLELPLEQTEFSRGTAFPVWIFKHLGG